MMMIATIIAGVAAIGLAATLGEDSSEASAATGPKSSAQQVSFDPLRDRNRYRIEMAPVAGVNPYDIGFQVTDGDGSNGIDVGEFLEGAHKFDYAGYMASGAENSSLKKIFDRLDDDGNGLIERSEYRNIKFTDDAGEAFLFEIVISGGGTAKGEPYKYTNRVELTVTTGTDLYEAAFAKTDQDNSGTIEKREFVASEFAPGRPAFKGFEREAGLIFDFMDQDDNGLVERGEYSTVGFRDDEGNEYLFEVAQYAQP